MLLLVLLERVQPTKHVHPKHLYSPSDHRSAKETQYIHQIDIAVGLQHRSTRVAFEKIFIFSRLKIPNESQYERKEICRSELISVLFINADLHD